MTRPQRPGRLMREQPSARASLQFAPQVPQAARPTPPPGGRHPGERMSFVLVPGNQSNSPRVLGETRRAARESGCGSQALRDGGGWSLAQEVGKGRWPGVRQGAGGGRPLGLYPRFVRAHSRSGRATGTSPAGKEGHGAAGA